MTDTNSYGRGPAASIVKRYGAYLIMLHETTEHDGEAVPSDLFDCASSLTVAKRLARAAAVDFGWEDPFHWMDDDGVLNLVATDPKTHVEDEE